ncbi:MAG: FtsW/RodA/SpoVE family cell cycle protein [Thermincola sp.]|jgi:cell division protein FtsW|nr:FtsW/RodA/SpoVE family cell cycle protein [Thermincola sp.]MDT3703994.1 FtsW/RodA/SpoVE family cell cycle protein [Thermincola sp.]
MLLKKRGHEGTLLIYVFVFLLLGMLNLGAAGFMTSYKLPVGLLLAVTASYLAVHFLLARWGVGGDMLLLPLTAMLNVAGMLVILRLSPEIAEKQLFWLLAGLTAFLVTVKGLPNYKNLEDYKYTYIFTGLLLLLSALILGTETGGARSWINFGFFKFQPSEIVKIILVIFLASYLEEKKEILKEGTTELMGVPVPSIQYVGPLVVMWGFSLVLLIFQNDLGTALIFFGTFLAMIFIAAGRWSYIISGTLLFSLGAWLCYLLYRHVQVRVDIWLNPWHDIDGKGYQIVQSLFAIGSGGFYGTGLGLGRPNLIPAVHTDFVYSAWSEEMGFLGAVALLLLYCLMIYRGYRIAMSARSGFGSLLASGLTSLLAVQTIVIVGGVIKLFPLTGVTLPFVSYGGSSLVSSYILLGLLINISAKDGS